VGKAASASNAKKAAKFGKQAHAAVQAIITKAGKFVSVKKRPISTDCRDRIDSAVGVAQQKIDASRF